MVPDSILWDRWRGLKGCHPGTPSFFSLAVRAAIYAGNALRAQGDLPAADKRFAVARGIITARGVTDTLVYAEVDWFEGTLRKDQRRFQEAEDLLARAITLYHLAGDKAAAVYPLAPSASSITTGSSMAGPSTRSRQHFPRVYRKPTLDSSAISTTTSP